MSFYIGNVELRHGLMLAPMAGVTDASFREICRDLGAEYTVSEMVCAKAMCYEQRKKSGEESKSGSSPDEARKLASIAAQLEHLDFQGLMTMAPADATDAELAQVFGGLRQLRDELAQQTGRPLPALSMGMSGDYPIAIREGSTIVRIGTAIFGNR